MTGTRADIARHLIARGLRLVPLHPVDDAGRCTCTPGGCRSPAKHPEVDPGQLDRIAGLVAGAPGRRGRHRPAGQPDRDRRGRRRPGRVGAGERNRAAGNTHPGLATGNTRHVYRLPDGFAALGNHVKPDGWLVDILTLGRAPGPGTRRADGEYAVLHDLPAADAHSSLLAWLTEKYDAREAARADVVPAEEPDVVPEPVQQLLETDGSADRSGMAYAIAAACFDAGLSQANAVWCAEDDPDVCDKFEGRKEGVAGEVARIWGQLEGKTGPEPDWLEAGEEPTGLEWFAAQGTPRWRALA